MPRLTKAPLLGGSLASSALIKVNAETGKASQVAAKPKLIKTAVFIVNLLIANQDKGSPKQRMSITEK